MKKIIFLIAAVLLANITMAQVHIDSVGTPAHNSAMLDITSHTRGLLIPRMSTAERLGIATPANGLFVFDSTLNLLFQYNAAIWAPFFRSNVNNIGNVTGTVNWDYQKGRVAQIVLNGDIVLNIQNPVPGMNGVLEVLQDGTGNRKITFPLGSTASGGMASLVLSAAPGTLDILSFEYTGTYYRWFIKNDVR